jgi:folate-binding protein YgfZ
MLTVLRVTGRDAVAFLQGQVTNDVRLLADGRTQLAACNTPQGRAIALLRLREVADTVHLLLPAELAEPVAAHLRRYVLRAKVGLEVATDTRVAWIDTGCEDGMPREGVAFDYAPGRCVVAASAADWRSATGLEIGTLPAADRPWTAADIADGRPQVLAAASAAFVPQMLNLDLLDGISFSKGCYTGQEIVARTQHLGRIKRRTLRYRLPPGPEPPPLAGLYRDGTKVAEVVMSATAGTGVELLAVTALEARGQALRLEDGRSAEPMALPYAVGGSE